MAVVTEEDPNRAESQAAVDKTGARVRDMFGQIAPRYDFMNHFLSGGVDYYWRWYTVRKAAPKGNAPILDVCSGTGDLAMAYRGRTGDGVTVIGSDFTQPMLRFADVKTRSQRPETGDRAPFVFLQADTQALPFASDLFQIVSVAFGLRNVADTRAGVREMLRVCQPGGRVVILEFSLPGNPLLRWAYGWYFRNVLPLLGQILARNSQQAYNYLPESVSQFPYGRELVVILEECGLVRVTCHPLTFGIASLYIGHKPE
jgi:demethylmenaquinone methyltransferase / 2-methoxy-6-polyprenyl-1,4-benzoquinol methylase